MSELLVTDSDIYAIHAAFSQTAHGQLLAERIRYERYKPGNLSNEEWVGLLGADVNNLSHMPLTYGLTKQFIKSTEAAEPGTLDAHEQTLLKIGSIIHDQGEAIIGDITYSEKTLEHELAERQSFEDYGDAFAPAASSELRQLITAARDEVVFDKSTKLGAMFKAVEGIGYLRTALRASEVTYDAPIPIADGCRWLVADVLGNQPELLTGQAEKYPPILQYLTAKLNEVNDAYHVVFPRDFRHYQASQRKQKYETFLASKRHWLRWANQQELAARSLTV